MAKVMEEWVRVMERQRKLMERKLKERLKCIVKGQNNCKGEGMEMKKWNGKEKKDGNEIGIETVKRRKWEKRERDLKKVDKKEGLDWVREGKKRM